MGQWRAWYARFRHLLAQHATREDKAGTFARRLAAGRGGRFGHFWMCRGVEATNNMAERAHRFGVLWRKRSQGTCSEKGNRWVERVLSLGSTPVVSKDDRRSRFWSKQCDAYSTGRYLI